MIQPKKTEGSSNKSSIEEADMPQSEQLQVLQEQQSPYHKTNTLDISYSLPQKAYTK